MLTAFIDILRTSTLYGHHFANRNGQGKCKCRTYPEFAFNTNVATHQFNQAARNGQPQTCATGAARGRIINLLELFKDFAKVVL